MSIDMTRVFLIAKAGVEKMPEPVARALFTAAADAVWLTRTGGAAQLGRNLARVRPDLDRRGLRRLTRQGMRAYLRYYCEAFRLPQLTEDQLRARVRATGDAEMRTTFARGGSVVAALAHTGNWDLAGAWAAKALAPVVTVAEHLEPEELFQDFLEFRTSLGMTIIPMDAGSGVFRQLIRHVRGSASIVPLLADRDLTASGVEVDLFGHRARVAAGPAALSLATGAPLHAAMIRHERLSGARRRAAGSRWGIVIDFSARLDVPGPGTDALDVASLTQRWVDVLAAAVAQSPADWHMLQKVFLEDLDAARLAAPSASAHEPR